MKIAIQGEAGSNSQLAALALVPGAEVIACAQSVDVFEALTSARTADAAVLPVENSLHGAVADHSDLLLAYPVSIVAEYALRIRHALMAAPGVELGAVTEVLSHPVALSQCRRYLAAHSGVKAVPFYDTAGAVKYVVQGNRQDAAAIAAPYAAEVYGAQILAEDLEDDAQNFTRFLLLARPEDADALRPAVSVQKMSVAFSLPHTPGSLVGVLQRLAAEGVDLTRIESRPVPGKPWEYTFFVDLGLPAPERAETILHTLQTGCHAVKELGRYAVVGERA